MNLEKLRKFVQTIKSQKIQIEDLEKQAKEYFESLEWLKETEFKCEYFNFSSYHKTLLLMTSIPEFQCLTHRTTFHDPHLPQSLVNQIDVICEQGNIKIKQHIDVNKIHENIHLLKFIKNQKLKLTLKENVVNYIERLEKEVAFLNQLKEVSELTPN